MGLFGNSGPVQGADDTLAQSIVAQSDKSRRLAEKLLVKNQAAINSMLEDGETVKAIRRYEFTELFVITDRRLLRLKKGKSRWREIPLAEVAETKIASIPNGNDTAYLVSVETHESKIYARSDRRKFNPDHHIQIKCEEPQDAQTLCAVIDGLLAGSAG